MGTGWQDVLLKASAGRYLAGDVGVTLDVSRSSPSTATVTDAPLIRDGGARLDRRYTLHELTRARDARGWQVTPAD